jgi:hypothetical protein
MPRFELPRWISGKEKIQHPEIEELRKPLEKMLGDMRERIEAGEYGLILGDDASGRIPTLIIDKVIKSRYARLGYDVPHTVFVTGSKGLISKEREGKQREIEMLLDHVSALSARGRRALIVTDTVASGSSLLPLAMALQEKGIAFDIATVGLSAWLLDSPSEEAITDHIAELQERLGNQSFYFGTTTTPNIYEKKELSGVIKSPQDLHARPAAPGLKNKDELKEARKDVAVLSEELIQSYAQSLHTSGQ